MCRSVTLCAGARLCAKSRISDLFLNVSFLAKISLTAISAQYWFFIGNLWMYAGVVYAWRTHSSGGSHEHRVSGTRSTGCFVSIRRVHVRLQVTSASADRP